MPLSRRNFIQNTVLGISAAGLSATPPLPKISRLPQHISPAKRQHMLIHRPAGLFILSEGTDWGPLQKK